MSCECPSDKASTSVGVEFGVGTSGIDEVPGTVGGCAELGVFGAELGVFGSAVVEVEVPVVVVVFVEVTGCKIELAPGGDC